jgi:phospholipase D1/2
VTRGGTPIYVHAKILIMDDRLMRVGSSNLNNRSLGFDTECDLSVEARPGTPEEPDLRRKIADLRTALIAEHLDVEQAAVTRLIGENGEGLIAGIEALRGPGRTLVPFVPPEFGVIDDAILRENELLDPERPARRRGGVGWTPGRTISKLWRRLAST